MTSPATPRCGFVALVGPTNVGKSTLLNSMVGAKISIVTPKVQTTRTRILGICLRDSAQLVFIDTPGIFAPKRRLDRAMVAAAWSGAKDADLVALMIDARHGLKGDGQSIVEGLKARNRPAVAIINKIDLVKKPDLLVLAAALDETGLFDRIFMISATEGDGVDDLLDYFTGVVPEGPWHYPEDRLTDIPNMLLAAEMTREKVYLQLQQELPYATMVETEKWEQRDDGSVRVDQVVYVERDSQKGIVLGKGGSRIKSIGEAARLDLEELFERRFHLFLFVKVRPRWGEDSSHYRDWGLDYNADS